MARLLFPLLLAVGGCGGMMAHHDYDLMCRVFTDEMANGQDPAGRATAISRRLDAELWPWSTLKRKVLPAIAMAAPEQRYKILQAAAAEEGYPGWECAPIRDLMAGAGEHAP